MQTHIKHLPNYKNARKVEQAIHSFLQNKGYLKLDLPVLSPVLIPESYLEVFETEFVFLDQKEKMYLTPSPELFIKRLLSEGIGDCYYFGKSFRNSEPNSSKHLPEFTMLELYKVGADYKYVAQEVLEMLRIIAKAIYGTEESLVYQGKHISLHRWEEFTIAEAFSKFANITEQELFDEELFMIKAKEKGYTTENFSFEELFSQIYVQEIEPHLGKNGYPTILYDYPKQFALLCRPNKDGKTAQRFEFYIEGIELGNCYGELTDWKLQEVRLLNEDKVRKETRKIQHPVDKGFIDALKKGMPDCSGIAIGFDRLAMIFADVQNINDLKLIEIS